MSGISSVNPELNERFLTREQAAREILTSPEIRKALFAGTNDYQTLMKEATQSKAPNSNIQHDLEAIGRLKKMINQELPPKSSDSSHFNRDGSKVTSVALEPKPKFGMGPVSGLQLQITEINPELLKGSRRLLGKSAEQVFMETEGKYLIEVKTSLAELTVRREIARYNECGVEFTLDKSGKVIGMRGLSGLGYVSTYTKEDITSAQTEELNLSIDEETLELIKNIHQ